MPRKSRRNRRSRRKRGGGCEYPYYGTNALLPAYKNKPLKTLAEMQAESLRISKSGNAIERGNQHDALAENIEACKKAGYTGGRKKRRRSRRKRRKSRKKRKRRTRRRRRR